MEKVMGDGGNTSFWEEGWVGGQQLKSRFKRLFLLNLDKHASVREMGEWHEGEWRWKWRWRRVLFDRELNLLNELSVVLNNCSLKQDITDSWKWRFGSKGKYTSSEAYKQIFSLKFGDLGEPREDFNLIWNKLTPLKVCTNAWRILWERIPTTTKLHRRRAIPVDANLKCHFCNEYQETVRHVFFECGESYQIWMACFNWLGVYTVLSSNPSTNLLHFSSIFRGRMGKLAAISIWECIVWLLWKSRNALVFHQQQQVRDKIVEEVKIRTWSWFSEKLNFSSSFCFEDWNTQPSRLIKSLIS
ncbi:hypothetical protein ACS0TY_001300 [Phlomoides rotata]